MQHGGRCHALKVKQGVNANGPRAVKDEHRGLGPRDLRSPCDAMGDLHRAYDEQEYYMVGQVKEEDDCKF